SVYVLALQFYTLLPFILLFFFNDSPTTEIYTLSLHDALPIYLDGGDNALAGQDVLLVGRDRDRDRHRLRCGAVAAMDQCNDSSRSEEHTSELQSRFDLVCRLLLEKKKMYI